MKAHSSSGKTLPVPFCLPPPVPCEHLWTVYPRSVSFLSPCTNRSYYPRTMGSRGLFHSAAEATLTTWIFISLQLSRGLVFTNELALPNIGPFMRKASQCVHQTRALRQWLRLLLMHEIASCGHYRVSSGMLCQIQRMDTENGTRNLDLGGREPCGYFLEGWNCTWSLCFSLIKLGK